MNNFNFLNVINVIKYLTITIIMGTILIIYNTIIDNNLISYLFLITMIIYFIHEIIKYIIKDEKDINNWFKNIIIILLNIYIFLIIIKKYSLTTSLIYSINETYFMINYIISIIAIIALIFSDILKPKKINNKKIKKNK